MRLLEGMTAERYAAFVRVQHLAACRCRDAAAAEDPLARLLHMSAAPPTGAASGEQQSSGRERVVQRD